VILLNWSWEVLQQPTFYTFFTFLSACAFLSTTLLYFFLHFNGFTEVTNTGLWVPYALTIFYIFLSVSLSQHYISLLNGFTAVTNTSLPASYVLYTFHIFISTSISDGYIFYCFLYVNGFTELTKSGLPAASVSYVFILFISVCPFLRATFFTFFSTL